jgi:signal transduction histidine kinase
MALASGEAGEAQQRARETLREVNDLIWSVLPSNDTLPSLADFISNFAARYLTAGGVRLDLDLPDEIPSLPIPSRLRHEVAGMFKETLRNVTQHARARQVVVRMRIEGGRLVLKVRDDGCGFDPTVVTSSAANGARTIPRPAATGHGLRNFQTRSAILGGICQVRSAPGHGTEVEFSIPLNGEFK